MPDFKRTPTVNSVAVALRTHTHPDLDSPLGLAGLTGWYAADQIPVAGGAAVATWSDLSGGGRHLTQATGSKQPTLIAGGGPNGLPVVRFDGGDWLASAAGSFPVSATRTIIAVGKKIGGGDGGRLWGWASQAGVFADGSAWSYYQVEGAGAQAIGGTNTILTVVTVAAASLAAATPYVNGTAGTTFNPDDFLGTLQEFVVGNSHPAATEYLNCDVGEVVVGTFAAAERRQLEDYLGAKWAITVPAYRYQPTFAAAAKWMTD